MTHDILTKARTDVQHLTRALESAELNAEMASSRMGAQRREERDTARRNLKAAKARLAELEQAAGIGECAG